MKDNIISYHIPGLWQGIFLSISFSISVGFVPPNGKTVLERQWAVTSASESWETNWVALIMETEDSSSLFMLQYKGIHQKVQLLIITNDIF